MTDQELADKEATTLRAAYPGAPDAVTVHERPELAQLWDLARRHDHSPQGVLKVLKLSAILSVLECPTGPLSSEAVLSQMYHPDFARYVAAKLGSM